MLVMVHMRCVMRVLCVVCVACITGKKVAIFGLDRV